VTLPQWGGSDAFDGRAFLQTLWEHYSSTKKHTTFNPHAFLGRIQQVCLHCRSVGCRASSLMEMGADGERPCSLAMLWLS
jgi:hypothetical protein